MSGRLENGVAALVIFALAYGLVAAVAFLVRIASKKVIPARVLNFSAAALAIVCIALLLNSGSSPGGTGLDAPFIAPPEPQMESFLPQFNTALEQLPPQDRASVTEATSFLTFAAGRNMMETDPAKFAQQSDKDLVAYSLLKMYRFAQEQGSSMTLRKYIWLAEEFKKQKPEWWQEYKSQQH